MNKPSNKRNCIPRLPPPRITSHLDALRLDLRRQLRQVRRHGTLCHGRGDQDAVDAFSLWVAEAGEEGGFESVEEFLEEAGDARDCSCQYVIYRLADGRDAALRIAAREGERGIFKLKCKE